MRRIVVIGPLGAGKSTLTETLGRLLDIPVYHLDWLYWGDSWTPTSPAEWQALLDEIVAGEAWIVDGNFTSSLPPRLAAADTVVYLDVPPLTSTIRAVKRRALHRWRRAPGVPGGERPMFNAQLFRWIWTFPREARPYLLEQLGKQPLAAKTVVLRSRRDVRRFLRCVAEEPDVVRAHLGRTTPVSTLAARTGRLSSGFVSLGRLGLSFRRTRRSSGGPTRSARKER